MSSKTNAACKTVAIKSGKYSVENKQLSPTSEVPAGGLVVYDNYNTLIEVTVKTKGRKRTSTMVSSSPTSQKGIEEKRKPGSSGDPHQNWARIFRKQNRATMKQTLQHFTERTSAPKPIKNRSDSKDSKKQSLNCQRHDQKRLDEVPVRQSSSQKKLEEQMRNTPHTAHPSTTSLSSSVNSILVLDKGVQCGGIFDSIDDRYKTFNPVRILGFLMKELEHLVKGEKASKILSNMEQLLLRISEEFGKSIAMDPEAIALRSKLEETTLQLEETSRKMNTTCETLREERDSLQRQVQKQNVLINKAQERQLHLETTIKALGNDLEDGIKVARAREKTIADLRTSIAEQTELARQRHLEVQYLTLEKDKLSVLCSYKDTLLTELRNSIKELQNQISDQLCNLNIYVHEDNNPMISLVHGGLACSSPTSSSSRESNIRTSCHEISDVSLSIVGQEPSKNMDHRRFIRKPEKVTTVSENIIGNLEKKRTKANKEYQTKDSANLEFVSLPCGESSLTLLPSYKDLGCTENNQSVNKGKGEFTLVQKRSDNLRNFKTLSSPPEKLFETRIHAENEPKIQRTLELQEKQSLGKKSSLIDASSKLKSNLDNNPIGSSISEQFHNIFHDIRVQSRMPVNIPSPPRSYPHPDWSDSTLPSISTASELNVIPSNDT
nr:uncharacterized protein LOC117220210 isoform X1 [Megalopta genalis]XP_033325846.1 uncharacterized protein LOC117220210 isoform X1 [Megalopta genalis]